jgi:hypothetical protein
MSARLTALAICAASLASLLVFACSAPPPETPTSVTSSTTVSGGATEPSPAAVAIWHTRCNQCHVRVEPKTRDRATLASALERHKKRAHLSETDVRDLVDYLAK